MLRYRVPNGHGSIPLADAEQALRTVRSHATEWGVDPSRIGVMGFSAGGHLAATASTLLTDPDTRPDFTILFYPVITMDPQWTHGGSRKNLLGANPTESATERYSAEKQVTDATPPAFIAVSNEDRSVSPVNSVLYYEALHKHRIPAELHIFPEGPHGFGLKTDFPTTTKWSDRWPVGCAKSMPENLAPYADRSKPDNNYPTTIDIFRECPSPSPLLLSGQNPVITIKQPR